MRNTSVYFGMSINKQVIDAVPTKHIVSLNNTRTMDDAANQIDLTLTDDSGIELEKRILTTSSPDLEKNNKQLDVQYGYYNGNISPVYTGFIYDWSTSFIDNISQMSVNAVSIETAQSNKTRRKSYKYAMNGIYTYSDVVKDVAKELGWKLGIIEQSNTLPVLKLYTDYGTSTIGKILASVKGVGASAEEARGIVAETITWDGTNGIVFLLEKIRPNAKSTNSGYSGFLLYFTYINGVPCINFHPPKISDTADFSYQYSDKPFNQYSYNSSESLMKKFEAKYNGSVILYGGGSEGNSVKTEGYDAFTNEWISALSNGDSVKRSGDRTNTNSTGTTYLTSSAGGRREFQNKVDNVFASAANLAYEASAEIVGNPQLDINQTIFIAVYLKGGIHHATGNYLIKSATDSINSAGEYSTSLDLVRNASQAGTAAV